MNHAEFSFLCDRCQSRISARREIIENAHKEGQPVAEIAKALYISRQAVAKVLKKLKNGIEAP